MKTYEFIIWDEKIPCSDGDRIQLAGFKIDNFLKNPVVYFNHNYGSRYQETIKSKVIGKVVSHRYDGGQLLMSVMFDAQDDEAAEIERKVDGGFLNAVSIGYIPIATDDSIPYLTGQRYPTTTEAELRELSIVEQPAHPNAVRQKSYAIKLKTAVKVDKKMEEEFKALRKTVEELTKTVEVLAKTVEEKTAKIEAIEVKAQESVISAKNIIEAMKTGNAAAPKDERENWTFLEFSKNAPNDLANMQLSNPERFNKLLQNYTKTK